MFFSMPGRFERYWTQERDLVAGFDRNLPLRGDGQSVSIIAVPGLFGLLV